MEHVLSSDVFPSPSSSFQCYLLLSPFSYLIPPPSSPPPLADCEAATRRRDEVARTAHEHSTVLDGVDMVLQQVLGVFEATQFESAQHARYVCEGDDGDECHWHILCGCVLF